MGTHPGRLGGLVGGGAGEERAVSGGGSRLREDTGGQSACWAHLCYHADAPHDDRSFGLSATHSAQPRGDKDLPSQVLDPQVPSPGIQHGELQGEEEEFTLYSGTSASHPRQPGVAPVSHHCAMDDALGTDVAVAACCHLAVPDHREGKLRAELGARHSFKRHML